MEKTEDWVELTLEGFTKGTTLKEAYVVVLREKESQHVMPLLLGGDEYAHITNALEQDDRWGFRLFRRLANRAGLQLMGVHLRYNSRGEMHAHVLIRLGDTTDAMRVSLGEGLLLSIDEKLPIWALRSQLELARRQQSKEGEVSFPIDAMPTELLKEALEKAVKNDEFELAAALQEVIDRRNEKRKNQEFL